MCSQYQLKLPLSVMEERFSQTGLELVFPDGRPNLEPQELITISNRAPVIGLDGEKAWLGLLTFAWKGPAGRPVFNFRSEGRQFSPAQRLLVPATAFFEFTDPQPGHKRKTRWQFEIDGDDWFWMAANRRGDSFALLTMDAGPDVLPYHSRQVVLFRPDVAIPWLLGADAGEAFAPTGSPALRVQRDFPPL